MVASGCTKISILSSVNIGKTFVITTGSFLLKKPSHIDIATKSLNPASFAWGKQVWVKRKKNTEKNKEKYTCNNTAQSTFQKTIPYHLCMKSG